MEVVMRRYRRVSRGGGTVLRTPQSHQTSPSLITPYYTSDGRIGESKVETHQKVCIFRIGICSKRQSDQEKTSWQLSGREQMALPRDFPPFAMTATFREETGFHPAMRSVGCEGGDASLELSITVAKCHLAWLRAEPVLPARSQVATEVVRDTCERPDSPVRETAKP